MRLLGEGGFGGCSEGIPKGKGSAKRNDILESEPIKTIEVLQLKCFYNVAGCSDMIPFFWRAVKGILFKDLFSVVCWKAFITKAWSQIGGIKL